VRASYNNVKKLATNEQGGRNYESRFREKFRKK
jgi:hypothetical protein